MKNLPSYFANNFIEWGELEGIEITHLKLQKLLYLFFARFYFLSKGTEILFEELPVKWNNGPVFESVYQNFKNHGKEPVVLYRDGDNVARKATSQNNANFRQAFWDVVRWHGNKAPYDLSDLTHGEKTRPYITAWEKAENNCALSLADICEDGRSFFEQV